MLCEFPNGLQTRKERGLGFSTRYRVGYSHGIDQVSKGRCAAGVAGLRLREGFYSGRYLGKGRFPIVDPARRSALAEPVTEQSVANESEDRDPSLLSLEQLYNRYYESVVYWFLKQGVGREEAKELAQDVFLAAHQGLDQFRGSSNINTWLFTIVRNRFKNYLRERNTLKRSAEEVSISEGVLKAEEGAHGELDLLDPSSSPEDDLVTAERKSTLSEAIEKLPPKMRQTTKLRLQGLKYQEIAIIMGISIESVKSHLHKARSYLRDELDDLKDLRSRPQIEQSGLEEAEDD